MVVFGRYDNERWAKQGHDFVFRSHTNLDEVGEAINGHDLSGTIDKSNASTCDVGVCEIVANHRRRNDEREREEVGDFQIVTFF